MPKKTQDTGQGDDVRFLNLEKYRSEINAVLASEGKGLIALSKLGPYLKSLTKESKVKQSWILQISRNELIALEKAMHVLNGLNAARKKCKLPLISSSDAIQAVPKQP